MLSPSEFNNAVPKFTNGNYANNPVDPQYIEEPTLQNYNRGVEPLETLPAQWWNWLCNQFTSRFNKINTYVKNIFDEITQLLSLLNISPDGTESVITTGQLKNFFKELYPTYVSDKLELGTTYVPQTRTVNGHALTGNITVTKSDVGLGSVANTGDSANASSGGTTKFTTGGAYNILTSIAPYFSTSTAYSVGALVTYQNKFYECTTSHSAGAWNSSHFTARSFSYVFTNYILPAFAPTFSTATAYSEGTFVVYQNRLYKCTTAHSAGAWNSSQFALATLNDVTVDTDDKLALKADKVAGATNNDIAILDTNGNLKDSGKSLADLTGITDLAPLFSTTATYAVGDYVIYSGNLYRCTTAHSAGAWNASHFTAVTVGGELENKADKSSLAVPSDAVLHYSFDDLPDYPDGTAVARNLNGDTYNVSLSANGEMTTDPYVAGDNKIHKSNVNGNANYLSDISTNNSTGMFKVLNSFKGKILIVNFKAKTANLKLFIQYRVNATSSTSDIYPLGTNISIGTHKLIYFIPSEYNSIALCFYGSNSLGAYTEWELLDWYIGDGSYSTPIIDNANGKWNSVSQSGVAVQGVSGKGVKCFANKYIGIGNFNLNTNFSISIWVNPENNTNGLTGSIIAKEGQFILRNGASWGNYLMLYVYKDTTPASGYRLGNLLPPNQWSNIVIAKENLNLKAYLNGMLVFSIVLDSEVVANNNNWFFINGDTNTRPQSYDDLLIFDRALTEAEVTALYLNKANTPKFYDINNYDIEQAETDLSGKVDKTTTVNGHALSDNVTVTKGDIGLGSVVNTGDSAVPVNGGTTKFTSGGAYNFFGGNTKASAWLGKVFGWALGRKWTQTSTSDIQSTSPRCIAYGNGLFVACLSTNVTGGGEYWHSEDGKSWTKGGGLTILPYANDIYYANGMWVACGHNVSGQSIPICWSEDGKHWTIGTGSIANIEFNSVRYADGLWVACSTSNGIWWSEDGKSWTKSSTSTISSYTFNSVRYADGLWVACSAEHGICWSEDGKNWTQLTGTIASKSFSTVHYANGLWVAGEGYDLSSNLWWSTDGKTWTQGTVSGSGTSTGVSVIHYANDVWVAGCKLGGLLYSADGKTWTRVSGSNSYYCIAVYFANGTWVLATSNHSLKHSKDGENWIQAVDIDDRYAMLSLCYGEGTWVASASEHGLWWSGFDNADIQ